MAQTTLNFGQALVLNAISKPEYLQKVYNTWQAARYNTLNQLIAGWNVGPDNRRVDQVKFFTGRQGGVEVSYLVNGVPTLSGTALTIPLAVGSGSNNIRVGDVVMDNNRNIASVQAKTANTITLTGIGVTLNTTTTFANTFTVGVVGNAS